MLYWPITYPVAAAATAVFVPGIRIDTNKNIPTDSRGCPLPFACLSTNLIGRASGAYLYDKVTPCHLSHVCEDLIKFAIFGVENLGHRDKSKATVGLYFLVCDSNFCEISF